MSKRTKLTIVLLLIFTLFAVLRFDYLENETNYDFELIAAGETTTVTSWSGLKSAVESGNYSVVKIKTGSSTDWKANSTITINKSISIETDSSNTSNIIITRGTTGILFDVKGGTFNLNGQNGGLTIDGSYSETTRTIIYISGGAKTTVTSVSLKNNKNSGSGGALTVIDGSLTLNSCTVSNNEGKNGGGIIVSEEGSVLKLNNTSVISNKATSGSGGGIYAYGTLTISNSDISSNTADDYGGGLMIKTKATITNTKFNNNTATNNTGGGIKSDGEATISGGEIKNNKSKGGGAGIDFSMGEVTYNNVTMSGNMAGTEEVNVSPDVNSPNNIDWMEDTSLNIKEISVTLVKKYTAAELGNYGGGTQGFAITDKFILITQHKEDSDPSIIHVVDKKTIELKNTIVIDPAEYGYTFGHINDLAYDKNTGFVYVLTTKKVDGVSQIAKFKLNSNGQMTDYSLVNPPRGFSGIEYDSDHNQFILYGSGEMWIYDSSFNLKKHFPAPTNLITQGIGYWKGYIYFCNYEFGAPNQYQTIFNHNQARSNLIYMYDLNGNLVKTLYIPNTVIKGELEGASFMDNEEIYMNFNYSGIAVYKSTFPIEVQSVTIKTKPTRLRYFQNEDIDLSGLVLGVTLNNEEKIDVNNASNVSVSGYDKTKLGKQNVTLTYKGARTQFEVEVLAEGSAKETTEEEQGNSSKEEAEKKVSEDNPKTGAKLAIKLLLGSTVLAYFIGFIAKNKRKLYKI